MASERHFGIDLSTWNTGCDYDAARLADGVEFAIMRCGFGQKPANKDNEFDTRYYGSAYDLSKSEVEGSAWANLDITYTGEYTDTSVKIKLDESTLKEHPEDVIDELYTSGSFKDGRFQQIPA